MKLFLFSKIFLVMGLTALASGASATDGSLTLTMGGDVNFTTSKQAPSERGFVQKNGITSWQKIFQFLAPEINGDLNFANIETVVTDQDLSNSIMTGKPYNFQSHVNSVRFLTQNGINLMSVANNHSYDYQNEGFKKTVTLMNHLIRTNPSLHYHGIGSQNEVSKPVMFVKNGIRIAFAAISFWEKPWKNAPLRPSANAPGMLNFSNKDDLNLLLQNMRDAKADFKILSIHAGLENVVTLNKDQQKLYRNILEQGDVDLVIGHHPHVVKPIEIVNGKVIVYSLGNYMMMGADNRDGLKNSHNYGLQLKATITMPQPHSRARITLLRALPLQGVHIQPRRFIPSESAARIQNLNALNQQQLSRSGAQFTIGNDGTGSAILRPR